MRRVTGKLVRSDFQKESVAFGSRVSIFSLVAILLFAAHSELRGELSPVPSERTPLELFKAFMASPPVIESVVYRKMVATEHTNGLAVADWPGTAKAFEHFYFARWQPECLFLKSGTNADAILPNKRNSGEVVVNRRDEYWMVDRTGLISYWQDRISDPTHIRAGPALAFHHKSRELTELMNMGVMYLGVGVVKWTGDAFTASGYIPEMKMPVEIKGMIKPTANQFAQEMDVQYRSRMGTYDYIFRYGYSTNLGLSFLPDKIQTYFAPNGEGRKMAEWHILSLKTSASSLDGSLFDPKPSVFSDHSTTIYYTNNTWYGTNSLGRLAPIREPLGHFKASMENLNNNNYYYWAVLLSTLFAFAFVWRAKNKINKPKKT